MGTHGVKNFPEPPHGPHLLAQLSDKPNFLYVTQEVVVMGSCSHVTNEANPRFAERNKASRSTAPNTSYTESL